MNNTFGLLNERELLAVLKCRRYEGKKVQPVIINKINDEDLIWLRNSEMVEDNPTPIYRKSDFPVSETYQVDTLWIEASVNCIWVDEVCHFKGKEK